MVLRRANPWETTDLASMVSVGTHKLHVSTSGPPRRAGQPVLIYITGWGAPAISHMHLQGLLSKFVRVYFYDRAGYDRSDRGPYDKLTAMNAAQDLGVLMRDGIRVKPPYVLVAHSYGGIIARMFLHQNPQPGVVAGICLADTATELLYDLFPGRVDKPLDPIIKGVDLNKTLQLREKSRLTDEEWEMIMEAEERTLRWVGPDEDPRGSAKELLTYQQYRNQAMGDRPLSVIRCNMAKDFWMEYNAGVEAGNGTEEERLEARRFIEKFELYDDEIHFSQLRLSSKSRYEFHDFGHAFPLTNPEVFLDGVKWLLQECGHQM